MYSNAYVFYLLQITIFTNKKSYDGNYHLKGVPDVH